MDGLHIFANLYRCRGEARYLVDRDALRDFCLRAIGNVGLTVLDDLFHQFEGGGTTGCVVLAESHFAIHTWPELEAVTLDAFVCNYSRDNSGRARALVDEVVAVFRPGDVNRKEVPRDLRVRSDRLSSPASPPGPRAGAPAARRSGNRAPADGR